jgi:hypothetical protein
MQPFAILAPVFALATLTFLVLTLVPIVRFRAAFAGKVGSADFKLGASTRVPAEVSQPNRNYMNLLEAPLLFYVVCVVCFVTRATDSSLVALAWSYVALRVVHSAVHVTYNNVFHRLTTFGASAIVLLAMWVYLFVRLFG